MSTNSTINVQSEDGTWYCVYCHWDGYPSHHLPILNEYYSDTKRAMDLVEMGDISVLSESIEDSIFYGRDRNEEDCECVIYDNPLETECYNYLLYYGENIWEIS